MEDALNKLISELRQENQRYALRTIKMEYELMVLKQLAFTDIAARLGADPADIESKHESLTHVALLANLDLIAQMLPLLDEGEIKRGLSLAD